METEASRKLEMNLILGAYGGYLTVLSERLVLTGMYFSSLGDRIRRGCVHDPKLLKGFYQELQAIGNGLENFERSRGYFTPFHHLIKKTISVYGLRYDIFLRDMRFFADSLSGEEAKKWHRLIDRFEKLAVQPTMADPADAE